MLHLRPKPGPRLLLPCRPLPRFPAHDPHRVNSLSRKGTIAARTTFACTVASPATSLTSALCAPHTVRITCALPVTPCLLTTHRPPTRREKATLRCDRGPPSERSARSSPYRQYPFCYFSISPLICFCVQPRRTYSLGYYHYPRCPDSDFCLGRLRCRLFLHPLLPCPSSLHQSPTQGFASRAGGC